MLSNTCLAMTAINFNNALGIHAAALEFRSARAEVLAGNIANADTVGYRARDISFDAVLQRTAGSNLEDALQLSDGRHIAAFHGDQSDAGALQLAGSGQSGDQAGFVASQIQNYRSFYRDADQPGLDGNTVDVQRESVEFARNAMDFSVSFRLLNGRFSGLSRAISGQ